MAQPITLTFILQCRNAINTMRRAGMNDTLIATVISDVRSVTLNEEYDRLKELIRLDPPTHHSFGVVKAAFNMVNLEDEVAR